ncbi:MAG: NADH-quinone oxidoreductase subunit C [Bacteroidetes bacterium]|nr:NADH-quinone oxidoreductase subunit C [Bacteroidota bacterium]
MMVTDELKKTFGEKILDTVKKNDRRISLLIDPGALLPMAEHLFSKMGFRFIIASALHTKRGFEIFYHFSFDQTGLILNLLVILDNDKPEVESLSNMFEATNWIEREMHELFGINFLNHPNLDQLLSEGNWAKGVYPYRKTFKSNGEVQA